MSIKLEPMVAMICFLGLSLGVVACGGDDSAACSTDMDCKGDRVCEAGDCVSTQPSGGSTEPDSSTNEGTEPDPGSTGGGTAPTGPASCDEVCDHILVTLGGCGFDASDRGVCLEGCAEAIVQSERDCIVAASTCAEADRCEGTGGGTGGESNNGGANNGGGTTTPPDTNQFNNYGDRCTIEPDCPSHLLCLRESILAEHGYCSASCQSDTDCPSNWSCGTVSTAQGKFCLGDW